MSTNDAVETQAAAPRTLPLGLSGLEWAIAILAGLGALDALYLTWVKLAHTQAICAGLGDCERVQTSPYSQLFGIPVAILGLGAYLVILAVVLWGNRLPETIAVYNPLIVFGVALVGVLFSAYLTYLELFVIEAICPYCVVSAVLITLIWLLSIWNLVRASRAQ
ncbi:MAG: vitamin K epoxide reductase family protein [Anaerolineae bacterium]